MGLFDMFKRKDMSAEIKEYLEKGAVVLDVRTQEEWNEGHTEGAEHIVLTVIPLEIENIKAWVPEAKAEANKFGVTIFKK